MIIIGEKINASIPCVKQMILDRDEEKLSELAKKQAQAGATYIDVNVATGIGSCEDEISAMTWALKTLQKTVDKPICIDSADPKVLVAGLDAAERVPLINSTTAEAKSLKSVLPLAVRYDAPVIALAMDEGGIPKSVEGRVNACQTIVRACEEKGVPMENVYIDPLVVPISTDAKQGRVTIDTLSAIKTNFPGIRTVLALSNVSFGLPARMNVNAAFLQMAIYAGLDAAILDPAEEQLTSAIRTAEAIIGKDRHFRRYIRAYRKRKK